MKSIRVLRNSTVRSSEFGVLIIITSILFCFPSSTSLAKKKITMPTDRAAFHNNQGVSYLNNQDIERAEFEFKTAVELSPDYAEAYNNLGIVYKTRGKYDESIKNFQKAIEINKNYAAAYSHLGAVYLAQGKIDTAITTIKKGLRKDGTIGDARYNLGLAYIEKAKEGSSEKNLKLAEEELKKATELDPNLTHVHKRLAELYKSMGRYDLSIIRYRLALANDPVSKDLWTDLGNLYLEKGEQYKAQDCFQRASEITPESSDPRVQMGLFYINEKRYDEAVAEFSDIVAKNPLNDIAWYYLGTAHLNKAEDQEGKGGQNNLYELAVKNLKKAKEVNPQLSDASYNLGLVLLKQGKTLEAEKEWEYTLVVNPNHARVLYNLGLLYQRLGKINEGLELLCKFVRAGSDLFPVEVKAAEEILDSNKFRCRH